MKVHLSSFPLAPVASQYVCHLNDGYTVVSKRIDQNGYRSRLLVIRPTAYPRTEPLSAFFYIPCCVDDPKRLPAHEQIASKFVIASGQAAIVVVSDARNSTQSPVFEVFAAMKWLAVHGPELGIDGTCISILGARFGANIAAVLSLMALEDPFPSVSCQILIDPQFFISGKHLSRYPPIRRETAEQKCLEQMDWTSMERIHNLPFEVKMSLLANLPPTLIQLSENVGNYFELDYYQTRLVHAGTDVTCTHYDDQTIDTNTTSITNLTESMIRQAAEMLRKHC